MKYQEEVYELVHAIEALKLLIIVKE